MSELYNKYLRDELVQWGDHARHLSLFIRDDDVIEDTSLLQHFIHAVGDVPILLGIIPSGMARSLVKVLHDHPNIIPAMHGVYHKQANYIKKCEFAPDDSLQYVYDSLRYGLELWRSHAIALPLCYIPPWNRLDSKFIPVLHGCGFRVLSGFAQPYHGQQCHGLLYMLPTHIDIINWQDNKQFMGAEYCYYALQKALKTRRQQQDYHNPIGLLTHHLMHDQAMNYFLENIIADMYEYMYSSHYINIVKGDSDAL